MFVTAKFLYESRVPGDIKYGSKNGRTLRKNFLAYNTPVCDYIDSQQTTFILNEYVRSAQTTFMIYPSIGLSLRGCFTY